MSAIGANDGASATAIGGGRTALFSAPTGALVATDYNSHMYIFTDSSANFKAYFRRSENIWAAKWVVEKRLKRVKEV
jgi:hypothetical protein